MISERLRPLLAPAEKRSRILWAGTTLSIVLVTALLWWLFQPGTDGGSPPLSPAFRNLAFGSTLVLAVASSVIRSHLLSAHRLGRLLERESRVDRLLAATAGAASPAREALEALSERDRKILALPACLLPAFLVGWGLNEAILLMGTVLVFLSGNFMDVLPFAFVAFALTALSFPRLDPHIRRIWMTVGG